MKIPAVATKLVGRHALTLSKQSPNLLFGTGVVGVVGSTVLACRATLKLETTLEKAQSHLDMARLSLEMGQVAEGIPYDEKDHKKDVSVIYVRSAVEVVKLYAPAILLGSASIAMLTKSHNMLNERNSALAAAYIALDKGFSQYRKNVVDKYGEEQDQLFRYEHETVTEKGEDGKNHKVTRVTTDSASIYARFFDQTSSNWSKDPEINMIFLKCQQEYANQLLHARGHVFLNEIYDSLGMERSGAGQVVGWMRKGNGDGHIDFNIFNDKDEARDFVNGFNNSILLDFNVDGPIHYLLDTPTESIKWQG